MGAGEAADLALRAVGGLSIPGVVGWFFYGRRKDRTSARVAERTEDAVVARADIGTVEANLIAVGRAFDMERSSLVRQIGDLKTQMEELKADHQTEVARLSQELEVRNREVMDLRNEVGRLTQRLTNLEQHS